MPKGKILIIDEANEERGPIVNLLSEEFFVEEAKNYTEAVEKLKRLDFDLIIMELKLRGRNAEKSTEVGIDLLFYIKQSDIYSAVLILTDYASLDTHKQARELGIYGYLSKRQTSNEKLVAAVAKAYEKFQSVQKDVITDFASVSTSFRHFDSLDSAERQRIIRKGMEVLRPLAEEKMDELQAKWLVLCGKEVVADSEHLEYPDSKTLEAIGEQHDRIPFLFEREEFIEEIAGSAIWVNTYDGLTPRPDDYYPTVFLEVVRDEIILPILADFDTGAPEIYTDLARLVRFDIILWEDLEAYRNIQDVKIGRIHEWQYEYYKFLIEIALTDVANLRRSENLWVNCISDWETSGFLTVNRNRQALVGRPLLLKFQIRLELDGKEKMTKIFHQTGE